MIAVLRHRNFALLWTGQLLSTIAFWMLFLALPFHVYRITGSALATGTLFFVQTIPRVLLSSIAGVFADRWDRRQTMIVTDLIRAVIILPILLVRSPDYLWIIYLFAFITSVVAQLFDPAKNAIIPSLVPNSLLLAANGLNAVSDAVTRLSGPLLGATILSMLGFESVIIINSGAYVVSAMLLALIVMPKSPTQPSESTRSWYHIDWGVMWRDWRAGLQLVRMMPILSALFGVVAIAMVAEGILNVLIVAFVQTVLRVSAVEWGWMLAAQGAGWLIGSLLMGPAGRYIPLHRLIGVSAVIIGVIIFIIVHVRSIPLAIGLFGFVGIPVVGFYVGVQTLLQSSIDDHYRGRIFGAYNTTQGLLLLVGIGLASALGDQLGSALVLDVAGCFYVLAGVVGLIVWWRAARGSGDHVDEREVVAVSQSDSV